MFSVINIKYLVIPFVTPYQLEVNHKYKTEDIDIVVGQYGPRVVVKLEVGKVSLPDNNIKASDIPELKNTVREKPVYLISKGMVGSTTNLVFVE